MKMLIGKKHLFQKIAIAKSICLVALFSGCAQKSNSKNVDNGTHIVVTPPTVDPNEKPITPVKLPPKEFTPSLDFDTRFVGETLTCRGSTSCDAGVSISYKTIWYISLDPNSSYKEIPGESSLEIKILSSMAHQWLKCQMLAVDSSGLEIKSVLSAYSAVVNSAPENFTPLINSSTVYSGEQIECSATASDRDGDKISYVYSWKKSLKKTAGFELIESANKKIYSPSSSDVNGYIRCEVAAKDELGRTTLAQSESVTVKNTFPSPFPSLVSKATGSGDISAIDTKVGDFLKCFGATDDLDGDSLSYSFSWAYSDTLDGLTVTEIPLASAAQFTVTKSLAHKFIRCDIKATDIHGDSTVSISSFIPVLNQTPFSFSSKIDAADAYVSDTLNCLAIARDPDEDSLSYSYQWFYRNTAGGAKNLISSEVFSTIIISPSLVRNYISCEAIVNDGFGLSVSSSESPAIFVKNSAPRIFSAASFPQHLVIYESIDCSGETSDIDEDLINYEYKWYTSNSENGPWTLRPFATSSNLFIDQSLAHKVIVCEKTATDNYGGKIVSKRSDWAYVDNTAPADFPANISATQILVNGKLVCSGTSSDREGDALAYIYKWLYSDDNVDFSTLPILMSADATSNTLNISKSLTHKYLKCQMTAKDAYGGEKFSNLSAVAEVLNTAPDGFTASAVLHFESAELKQYATCSGSSSDLDADTIKYEYIWYSSLGLSTAWELMPVEKSKDVTVTAELSRKYLKCQISAKDSPYDGITLSSESSPVYIANSSPNPFAANIDRTEVSIGESLRCSGSTNDNDGDTLSYSYLWLYSSDRDGSYTALDSSIGDTLIIGAEFAHGFLLCKMFADDGFSIKVASSASETAEVLNSAPSIFSATASLNTVDIGGFVSCNGASEDIDFDNLTYEYEWWVFNSLADTTGQKRNSATQKRFDVTSNYSHQFLKCKIKVSDGHGALVTTSFSGWIAVENTKPETFNVHTDPVTVGINGDVRCVSDVADFIDIDGDIPFISSYEWYYRNQLGGITKIDAAVTEYFRLTSEWAHKNVLCDIIISDGFGGETASNRSAATIYINSPPNPFNSTIDKTSAKMGDTVSCGGLTTDNDSDALTYSFRWKTSKNVIGPFTYINGATSSSLVIPNSVSIAHAYVSCEVSAADGFNAVTNAQNLSSVFIENTNPVLTAISNKTVIENSLLKFTVVASDFESDKISFSCPSCPAGALVDPDSGNFTYTPGYSIATSSETETIFAVKIQASDIYGGVAQTSFSLTVQNKDRPPVVTLNCASSAAETSQISFSYTASDPDPEDTPIISLDSFLVSGGSESPVPAHNLAQTKFTVAGSYSNVLHSGNKTGYLYWRDWTVRLKALSGTGLSSISPACTTRVNDVDRPPVPQNVSNDITGASDNLCAFTRTGGSTDEKYVSDEQIAINFAAYATDPDGDQVTGYTISNGDMSSCSEEAPSAIKTDRGLFTGIGSMPSPDQYYTRALTMLRTYHAEANGMTSVSPATTSLRCLSLIGAGTVYDPNGGIAVVWTSNYRPSPGKYKFLHRSSSYQSSFYGLYTYVNDCIASTVAEALVCAAQDRIPQECPGHK